jgi:MFS family permease
VNTSSIERARSRRALIGACAAACATGWNNTNIGAIATTVAHQYGIGLAEVGLFTTALFLTHMIMQIPAGKASERFGARRTALAGLCVLATANAIALAAGSPLVVIAIRALMGVGTGLVFVSGSAYVRESGGSPFAQGLYGGLGLGGGGLAIVVVPQVVGWVGWRAPYTTALLVSVAAFAVLLVGPPDRPWRRPQATDGVSAGLFGDARLYRLAAVYAASLGLSIVIGNWVVTLLERSENVSSSAAGVVGGLALLLPILSRPLGGWILRVHPARIRAAVALSLAGGALGTLALIVGQPLPLAAAGAILIGIAAGIPFAPAFLGAAQLRPDSPVAAVGLVNAASSAVVVAGTPLLGLTFSLPGTGRIGFAVVAVLWLGSLAAMPSAHELGAPDTAVH